MEYLPKERPLAWRLSWTIDLTRRTISLVASLGIEYVSIIFWYTMVYNSNLEKILASVDDTLNKRGSGWLWLVAGNKALIWLSIILILTLNTYNSLHRNLQQYHLQCHVLVVRKLYGDNWHGCFYNDWSAALLCKNLTGNHVHKSAFLFWI